MKNNPFFYATIGSLIGTATYILIKYLLITQFDWITTIIIFAVLWIGNFVSYKIMKRRK
jgi:hypothetical protein